MTEKDYALMNQYGMRFNAFDADGMLGSLLHVNTTADTRIPTTVCLTIERPGDLETLTWKEIRCTKFQGYHV